MISVICLKDFQSHKETTLKLHPLFNIIVGPSGNGKSSIIRALSCLAFNQVGTAEVRLPDAKAYHVSVEVDGHTIERDKGSGVNSYTIDKTTKLVDVNKDVPDEVKSLLNIHKIELDSACDVNIQFSTQLDAPFMLCEKDSVKMKFLNILSGTNAVDLAAKRAVAITKENTRVVKNTAEELKKLKEAEESIQKQLAFISDKVTFLKKANKTVTDLKTLRQPFVSLQQQSDFLFSEYKKLKIVDELVHKIDTKALCSSIDTLGMLYETRNKQQTLAKKYKELTTINKLFSTINTETITTQIDTLIELLNITSARDSLKQACLNLKDISTCITTKLIETIQLYKKALHENKTCPVCGNTVTKECVDNIINNL